jgi:meso-butanediol dehydrogenase/(S,S)-butanediol dehydrogenase/diacetyl reductase
MRLDDRIAIVTGGASGIGLASTRRLLEEGAAIVMCNIAAEAGQRAVVGNRNSAAHCASKGGIGLLTKAMALDYSKRGIRVNAICCGEVETPLFAREAAHSGLSTEEFGRMLGDQQPIGCIGQVDEVAAAVAFLASDDASFITGALIPVDGGYSAG